MLDFPASGVALWSLFDRGGPRPEYVLAMLYAESQFSTSAQNSAGAPYYGINQASVDLISSFAGVAPSVYVTWSASEQIDTVVSGMLLSLVKTYGPLRSGARLEQAQLAPSTLGTVRSLGGAIYQFPSAAYQSNASLDIGHKGAITVGDCAHFIAKAASSQAVQDAIAQTYALRTTESPRDPVYGEDFGPKPIGGWIALSAALTLVAYAVVRK